MRLACIFLVGIAAVGCKDKQPAPAAEHQPPAAPRATPETPRSAALPQPTPPPPALDADKSFEAETRDAVWASATEQAIEAVAPQLTDVTCRRMQCRVTLTAASEAELVAATDKLEADDSLRGIEGAQHILLSRPEQEGGKYAMKIYVRFDRDQEPPDTRR
jgi:hypothetical protein